MSGITLIAGYPEYDGAHLQFRPGHPRRRRARQPPQGLPAELPGLRREALFYPRHRADGRRLGGVKAGILVCEDIWDAGARGEARGAGAEVLLVINASPYEVNKQIQREPEVARRRVERDGHSMVFVNSSGARTNWSSTAIPSSWTRPAR